MIYDRLLSFIFSKSSTVNVYDIFQIKVLKEAIGKHWMEIFRNLNFFCNKLLGILETLLNDSF